MVKIYTQFSDNNRSKSHTLWGRTCLFSLSKGVIPRASDQLVPGIANGDSKKVTRKFCCHIGFYIRSNFSRIFHAWEQQLCIETNLLPLCISKTKKLISYDVHVTPEKVENASWFLPLHATPSWKRGISKTIFKPDEFENAAFRLRVEENVLKTFWKRRFSKKNSSR